ncbi:helix-turn-helix domain-containing protein [Sinomicrobium sp. M5D2P17]
MKENHTPFQIKSILEEHRHWGLPSPKHPLVSIFRSADMDPQDSLPKYFTFGFYAISIKKDFEGKLKYGQRYYDFDAGVMSFVAPNQAMSFSKGDALPKGGTTLLFHPDFLHGYPLAKEIKKYGFFSYELTEALHLSEQEEAVIDGIFNNIQKEYEGNIDHYSQDVIIAQIELLLQYSNRFYNRQFITRKIGNSEILVRLEKLLNNCFDNEKFSVDGLPTVQYISEQLNISPNYLSDMLRNSTGQTTQQHIHNKLIEKAKELLTTTQLTVREIAYQLGFEYPQSFNKLFRNKTHITPSEFRSSFNN